MIDASESDYNTSIVEMQHEMNVLKSLLIQYSRMFIQTFPAGCFFGTIDHRYISKYIFLI